MVRYLMSVAMIWFWLISPAEARAQQGGIETDANLLTALDVSDSIDRRAAHLQFQGMARAVLDPDFLEIVQAGRHGRIGFAIFTWAAGRNVRIVVPWTAIETVGDARRVAGLLEKAADEQRPSKDQPGLGSGPALVWYEFRTDVSAAIDHARAFLAAAPYRSGRDVLNVCANGEDNVGEGPAGARDRALAEGTIVNALALGERQELGGYLREQVQGGPASFVLEARAFSDFSEAVLRKFLMDLIAARPAPLGTARG